MDISLGRIVWFLSNLEVLDFVGCCNIMNIGFFLCVWGLLKLKDLNFWSCWYILDIGIVYFVGFNVSLVCGNKNLIILCL